jgi:hypothetical protein
MRHISIKGYSKGFYVKRNNMVILDYIDENHLNLSDLINSLLVKWYEDQNAQLYVIASKKDIDNFISDKLKNHRIDAVNGSLLKAKMLQRLKESGKFQMK